MKIGVMQLTSIHAHVSYCIHTFFSSKLAKKKLVEKSKRKRQKEIRLQYYCIKIRLKEDDDDKKYLETAAITDAFLCWQTEREAGSGVQSPCATRTPRQQPRRVLE